MIKSCKTKNTFQLEMSATLENIDAADDLLTEHLQELNLPIDLFAVRIMIRESLLNSVAHGNRENPEKKVYLTFTHDCDGIEMTVRDEGEGFNWQNYLTRRQNGLAESGRGLALMSLYSDEMSYNDNGSELILRKYYIKTGLLEKNK